MSISAIETERKMRGTPLRVGDAPFLSASPYPLLGCVPFRFQGRRMCIALLLYGLGDSER
jgi:hypothetical protein